MVMATADELVEQFAKAVECQAKAMRMGDSKEGNKYARSYIKAFAKLRAMGDRGREALVPLMTQGREEVRVMAAAFLLRYCRASACRVLEEIAGGKGFSAFAAGETLARWREGVWNLDPE
jgi:hypothetical protein